jgi:hypothetical protein
MRLTLFFCVLWSALPAAATELGIEGTRFTIDDKPTFLLGASYYAGLGAKKEFVRRDLDELQRFGFNWIRVWATWSAFQTDLSAVNASDGNVRQPFFDRLEWLIAECDRRHMIVDVTLSRGDGTGATRVETQEQHRAVVNTLVTALKSHRNWYLDLSNERNIRDKRFTSFDDLARLQAELKQRDPRRLVTASHGGDISREDLARYLTTAHVDFVAPHRPRDADSAAHTAETTRQLFAWMKELGRVVPVHYQEPFRRGYGTWEPQADDFVKDARAAFEGGAAGWCLHNGSERNGPEERPRRSFDLRERRLFDQLDDHEKAAVEHLRNFGS